MRQKIGIVFVLVAAAACAGASPQVPHPAGWASVEASSGAQLWSNGAVTPDQEQRYQYRSVPYAGDRQDLASREAIRSLLHYPRAKLVSSVPFPGCEGLAGLMTFQLQGGGGLQEAFTVRDGSAITVAYAYPRDAIASQEARDAMSATVCVLPGSR